MNATLVADPLRLLDCSPVSDGGAAVILCSADIAKKFTDTIIKVKGTAPGFRYNCITFQEKFDDIELGSYCGSKGL